MAAKRPREDEHDRPSKKPKKGFSVGPANLPDGTYKRKVQKIKKNLIRNAKIKKDYAKLRVREEPITRRSVYDRNDELEEPAEPDTERILEPHPDRLKLLEKSSPEPASGPVRERTAGKRKLRPQTYKNETEYAEKRQAAAEAKRKAWIEAERQRREKLEERERFRKAMAKAKGGPNGQRKLGRESTVLLEKVKKLVGHI